jgi:hypothetical protein
MKNKREIDQSTVTNPYSTGGLLPFHHGVDVEDVGEGGDPSGGGSGGLSPSNLCWFWLCFGVSLFLLCSPRGSLGKPYIWVFRLNNVHGQKNQADHTTKEEKRGGDAPSLPGRAT